MVGEIARSDRKQTFVHECCHRMGDESFAVTNFEPSPRKVREASQSVRTLPKSTASATKMTAQEVLTSSPWVLAC